MAATPAVNGVPKAPALVPLTSKNSEMIQRARQLNNVPWCDQYERMISGMLYNSFVPDLEEARLRSRKLCRKYNDYLPDGATTASLAAGREAMIEKMVGKAGKECFMEPPVYFDYGCNIVLGERFYANTNLCILDDALITIGDRTMFGPNVSIFGATHETEVQSRRDNIEFAREISIGRDCWIGGHVVILPGVVIGDGCTIGAGSVVTKSIPAFSVAMGMPARVVKRVQEC